MEIGIHLQEPQPCEEELSGFISVMRERNRHILGQSILPGQKSFKMSLKVAISLSDAKLSIRRH